MSLCSIKYSGNICHTCEGSETGIAEIAKLALHRCSDKHSTGNINRHRTGVVKGVSQIAKGAWYRHSDKGIAPIMLIIKAALYRLTAFHTNTCTAIQAL